YLQLIGFWRTMLDDLDPHAVVFSSGIPQFGFDHVLYQLCRADDRQVILFRHTYIEERGLPTSDIFEVPGPTPAEIAAAPPEPATDDVFASPTNEALNQRAMHLRTLRRKLSLPGVVRTLIGRRYLGRLDPPQPWFLYQPQPRYYQVRWQH